VKILKNCTPHYVDLGEADMAMKRKSDGLLADGPGPNKKSRYLHGQQGSTTTTITNTLQATQNEAPKNLPALPPISAAMWKTVFTHQSAVPNKESMTQLASYERLEFLGDAYIEVMATRLIWSRFKNLPAGRLSQLRELLVKNQTLGEIASKYGLDTQIKTTTDVRSNPKQWAKVKGDLIEAYVAAIVLPDEEMGGAGFAAAEKWLHQLWVPKFEGVLEEKVPDVNAKDALSRKVVSRGVRLEYLEERPMEQLKGGQQTYFIGAFLTGWGYKRQHLGSGKALNKTGAGNLAADDALQNPLTTTIAEMKRDHDQKMNGGREVRNVDGVVASKSSTQERTTREKELVEKKRNMFMSTEFG
jgi:ribonuclease III